MYLYGNQCYCVVLQVTAALITEQLLSALQYDNQLSVRYLIEWQTVLLLKAYPELIDDLFLPCLNHVRSCRKVHIIVLWVPFKTKSAYIGNSSCKTTASSLFSSKELQLLCMWIAAWHL